MRPERASPRWAVVIVVGLALSLLGGCAGGDPPAADPATRGGDPTGEPCAELQPIGDFSEVEVVIGDDPECLLLAETPEERARGLMEVTDLEGYAGMLFVFPEDAEGGFWMRNTPMPLSIAYLDADGAIVSTADMEPCDDVPTCPSYPAEGPYRFTVEVPRGQLPELGLVDGARLTVVGSVDPS